LIWLAFLQKLGVTDLFNGRLANLTGIYGNNQNHLFVSNGQTGFIDRSFKMKKEQRLQLHQVNKIIPLLFHNYIKLSIENYIKEGEQQEGMHYAAYQRA